MSLHDFELDHLAPYMSERAFPASASRDFRIMFAGRDNIHDALKHVLSRVRISLYLNMFGYADPSLNDLLMSIVHNRSITCMITLDSSQAGGKHERALLESDAAKDPDGFKTSFIIGQSATHRISHTKGFVADGCVGAEGSTNWSNDGEGVGTHAQNNTQTFLTDPWAVHRFQAELIHEHLTAVRRGLK